MTDHVIHRCGFRTIRMNRPDKKNALTLAMYEAMTAAPERANAIEFSGTYGKFGAKRCASTADHWINKGCSVNAVSKLVADFSNKINDGAGSVFMVVAGPAEISARTYYPLNGNGADFHAANKAAVLSITQDTAGDYLRYFTLFMRTDDGEAFEVIKSLSGYALLNEASIAETNCAKWRPPFRGMVTM